MTEIRCPLYEAALISRHEPAIVSGDQIMLYYELDEYATRVARNLEDAGLAAGDRIGIFLPSDWQYVALLFGILRLGAVACPISTRLPRKAVLDQMRSVGCRHIVARLQDPEDPELAGFDVFAPEDLMVYRAEAEGEHEWRVALDSPATIVFTSGSAGRPKAVQHSYGNHYYSARGSNVNIRLASRDCWLLSLPLYHVGGIAILFRCVLAGATMAIQEPDESLERAQEHYGVTHLSLVPTQLAQLLASANLPPTFTSLKAILLGGAAANPGLLRASFERHWPVFVSYGLTEMASQVCTTAPTSPPAKRWTSGQPLKYGEVRVNGNGEIEVRGATRFQGYVDAHGVEAPFDADGWFATGDLGAMDDEGYLTVHGRKDNMFISGGENIQPEEIESILSSMSEVGEAVVVPVPDATYGARPVAFVRWNGEGLSLDALRERLSRVLPRFKIPDAILPWPHQGGGMKSDRAALRALAEAQAGRP